MRQMNSATILSLCFPLWRGVGGLEPLAQNGQVSQKAAVRCNVLFCNFVLKALECLGENARRDEEVAIARPT